jgi:hypothetical protein
VRAAIKRVVCPEIQHIRGTEGKIYGRRGDARISGAPKCETETGGEARFPVAAGGVQLPTRYTFVAPGPIQSVSVPPLENDRVGPVTNIRVAVRLMNELGVRLPPRIVAAKTVAASSCRFTTTR